MFIPVLFFPFRKNDYYCCCNCVWRLFGHFPLSGQIFYVFYYYYVCLPQLVWNSSACRKHVPGKLGLVCAQVRPTWVVAGLVPTPLSRKLRPSAAGSSPTLLAQSTTLQCVASKFNCNICDDFILSDTRENYKFFWKRILQII